MDTKEPLILTMNGGSSSLKSSLYVGGSQLKCLATASIERIGTTGSTMIMTDRTTGKNEKRAVNAPTHGACVEPLMDSLKDKGNLGDIVAVGHRVVHGGPAYRTHARVTMDMLTELRRIGPYDPEHLPVEIDLIEEFGRRFPSAPQVACFDTAFHRTMPRIAQILPIPRRYAEMGVQRYGFHGLSYAFLMNELTRIAPDKGEGRVILAHLGNGASMAAVSKGQSVETTMGFTPTSGLPMSRRSGDLDPGLVAYLARTERMDAERFHAMVNKESGLLGMSEYSSDLRDLLERESLDSRAAEAVEVFCYQARKWIGALAAALGGLDTLVFSAGIGEHSPVIRARICAGLGFLGVEIDAARNEANARMISRDGCRVTIMVIPTDEEQEIARTVWAMIGS
ncbi:Acetate kinase [Nitrospira sp. KM1]|uniref:acetate/propionate family kinase n=1 Tax=Nitrospira sp. KM1 TaxID=1936990 RepID=UPI0013A79184|nr:acetate/propionate family kinase [Nitrospira sp. KM1]BCA53960.1 Acetate kinase [Nitrospira sp. KM1]